jgi:hypothetical protein
MIVVVLGVPNAAFGDWWWDPTVDEDSFDYLSMDQKTSWSNKMLGAWRNHIAASARRNQLPPRLVASCILGELLAFDPVDQAQEYLFSRGSVGPAQINVGTAIKNNLLKGYITNQMIADEALFLSTNGQNPYGPQQTQELANWTIHYRLLKNTEIAIEASARYLSLLVERANQNLNHTWPSRILRGPISRNDPYANVIPEQQYEFDSPKSEGVRRERALSLLLCSAYNTETILYNDFRLNTTWTQPDNRQAPFYNARTQGVNAVVFSIPLIHAGWFAGYPIAGGRGNQVVPDLGFNSGAQGCANTNLTCAQVCAKRRGPNAGMLPYCEEVVAQNCGC